MKREVRPGYWVMLNPRKAIFWKDDWSGIALDAFQPGRMIAKIPGGVRLDRVRFAIEVGKLLLYRRKPKEPALDYTKKDVPMEDHLKKSIPEIKKMIEGGRFGEPDTREFNTAVESLLSLEVIRRKPRKSLVKYLSRVIKGYASELAIGILQGGKEGMETDWKRKKVQKGKRPLKDEPDDIPLGRAVREEKKEHKEAVKSLKNNRN